MNLIEHANGLWILREGAVGFVRPGLYDITSQLQLSQKVGIWLHKLSQQGKAQQGEGENRPIRELYSPCRQEVQALKLLFNKLKLISHEFYSLEVTLSLTYHTPSSLGFGHSGPTEDYFQSVFVESRRGTAHPVLTRSFYSWAQTRPWLFHPGNKPIHLPLSYLVLGAPEG